METNLKKLLPIVSVVCLGFTQGFADTSGSSTQMQMAVPPSPTPGESGPNVFLSADYTLWTARENGLAVATSNYYAGGTTDPVQGKVYYPKMKLVSGFKVDLGVYLPHDNWDLKAEYTWFNNNNNGLHDANFTAGDARSTFFPTGADTIVLSSASSSWNVWFNRIDLTMGRSFFAGHYLAVRPFMGLLGAWDNQRLRMNYTSESAVEYDLHNSQKWWGIGAYGGMNSTFTFVSDSSNQWSLFLDAGTALPWSKFNGNQYSESVASDVTTTYYQLGNTLYNVTAMLETALGIRWETWWSDGSWMFLLQAAWEEQVWFNHNNFVVMGSNAAGSGGGAYTMQGLTVKAALAF